MMNMNFAKVNFALIENEHFYERLAGRGSGKAVVIFQCPLGKLVVTEQDLYQGNIIDCWYLIDIFNISSVCPC